MGTNRPPQPCSRKAAHCSQSTRDRCKTSETSVAPKYVNCTSATNFRGKSQLSHLRRQRRHSIQAQATARQEDSGSCPCSSQSMGSSLLALKMAAERFEEFARTAEFMRIGCDELGSVLNDDRLIARNKEAVWEVVVD